MEIARFIKEEVKVQLKKCLEKAQDYLQTLSGPKLALVIDGKCLMYALDPSLRVMLLNLSLNCSSVVCCRVSPLQKAQVGSRCNLSKSFLIWAPKGAWIRIVKKLFGFMLTEMFKFEWAIDALQNTWHCCALFWCPNIFLACAWLWFLYDNFVISSPWYLMW